MHKVITSVFLLLTLSLLLIYPSFNRAMMETALNLWVVVIIPSFIPMYILASFLNNYPLISKLTYPFLRKIMHFENQKACSLFLLSLLCGQPTVTILIQKAINQNVLSIQEGNRLMRFTSLLSPLFIINMCALSSFKFKYIAYLIIFCQVLASITIAFFSKKTFRFSIVTISNQKISIDNIIDEVPHILLNILMTIILTSFLKMPFQILITKFNINNLITNFILDCFEITTGLYNIIHYQINELLKIFLINFLLSFTGLCILIQVKQTIKKTRLNFANYIFYRIIHGLLSGIFCLAIILFIFGF